MSQASLNSYERDVENARARLAISLGTLRDPATVSAFTRDLKREAVEAKDGLVEQAKSSAQSAANGFVEDLKAKAAANPAAALAIGAGLAWHLVRHPPITTALVGLGLYSLWRTEPLRRRPGERPDYMQAGKDKLKEQTLAGLNKVKDMAAEVQDDLMEKAGQVADATTAKVRDLADRATETIVEAAPALAPELTANDYAQRGVTFSQRNAGGGLGDMLADASSRDKVLLGAAGLAVAAALGIACQKRLTEE